MKLLKHILVVVALMVAAIPCCHAAAHDVHGHEHDAESQICAVHHCTCHSCDEIPCSDEFEIPKELTVAAASVAIPPSSFLLFVFTDTKPAARQDPPSISGILAAIQTVQLLI